MLTLADLDQDQTDAIDHCFEADATLLIAGMGAGKTIIALTCIEELLAADLIKRVLVVAPLKVCNKVWRTEHLNWAHTTDLRVGIATEAERAGCFSMIGRLDIVVINFEQLPWLAERGLFKLFDALVIDEATKLAAGGAHFKALRRHLPDFNWRLVMAGEPLVEGYPKAFYTQFLVDNGAAFGRNKQKWLDKYLYPTDYGRYKWAVKPGQEPKLAALMAPTTYTVPDYRDTLPPLSVELVTTPLPAIGWTHYKEMAGKLKTAGVTAKNAAVKSGKLSQIANGFLYGEPPKKGAPKPVIRIHDVKDRKLAEIFSRLDRSPILIAYQFIEELAQLRARYPDMAILADDENYIDDWCAGRLNVLAMSSKSGSHGLNLASGGHEIVWLSPPWSADIFRQFNSRLWRRGQVNPVRARILFAPSTIDELIWQRQGEKAAFMPQFLDHLKNVAKMAL